MIRELTREKRKIKRMMDMLYREDVERARHSVASYRKRAKELRDMGYSDTADTLEILMKGSQAHQDILNEIVDNLRTKLYLEEEKKYPREAIEVSRKYAGVTGTVRVRYENGSIRLLPRRNYLMMRDAGRDVTLVS